MLRPDTLAFTLFLAMLTGTGPLSVDMYLASLPAIGHELSASPAQVQLTLSAYLVGLAIGQLVYGPVSDRFGRKPVVLAALSIYTVTSLACTAAGSIEMLIGARLLQAIGGAGATVIARAIVRDLYEGTRAGRELSLMGAIMALAPVIAPVLGGVIQTLFGWRMVFALLVAVGLIGIVTCLRFLPETLRHRAEPISAASMLRAYASIGGNHTFLAYVAIVAVCFGGVFAWISGSAFVLQNVYGLSPFWFSIVFAVGSGGLLIGMALATRLVPKLKIDRMIGYGSALLTLGGGGMLLLVLSGLDGAIALALLMAVYLVGFGFTMPQAMAGALTPFAKRAGTASSVMGFTQQVAGASVGAIVGATLGHSALPMVLPLAVSGVLAVLLWSATREVRLREIATGAQRP